MGKIKYAAYDKSGDGTKGINWTTATQGGLMPDIGIYRFNYNFEYASDEIFSTTVHETAHTTHMNAMNGLLQFAQISAIVVESWPTAVEWQVTQMEYRERGIINYSGPDYDPGFNVSYPIRFGYQNWNLNVDPIYTSLYIDIIDNHNQSLKNLTLINDNVSGFTLPQIEGFIKHIYGLSSLSSELKVHKPASVTDAQIDQLIAQY